MTTIVEVENKMITLRNQQVIIDADVADLYGVETKRINEAVSNNPEKFPDGYILELSKNEKNELVENFDRFNRQKHSTAIPKAFTEKGLYMLATILKSPKAVETTIAIVEAYAKLKELARVITEVPQHEDDKVVQQSLVQRGGQLAAELLSDTLPIQSSETSVELNLAMFKFKHTVKRENDDEIRQLKERVEELERKTNP
ncbi:MAG: ORF6N domain-containing protein [Bacteroidales bacterium]|nr:ORF6N domain-containing protein [Bacteroidales bacterium]